MISNKDREGRKIDYLRISVTDRSNARGIFCMDEFEAKAAPEQILTDAELVWTAQAAAACGICHLRLTGGEPLLREGCAGLVRRLKAVEGIETVTMSTNGLLLAERFADLKNAGIDGVNISLDTLVRERYRAQTGCDGLEAVLQGIKLSVFGGVRTKLNVTVTAASDPEDLLRLAALAETQALDVRFIEVLPLGNGRGAEPMDNYRVLRLLRERYPGIVLEKRAEQEAGEAVRPHGFGPAVYYTVPGFQGSIGFISAIHDKFCQGCNRLRLSCTGWLRGCLCYEDGIALAPILRAGSIPVKRQKQLREAFKDAMVCKPKGHPFGT